MKPGVRACFGVIRRTAVALLLGTLATAGWSQALQGPGPVLLDVTRFTVEGDNPLAASETDALLSRYAGPKKSLSDLDAAAKALEDTLRDKGFAFHRVIVPAQKPSGGVVKLQILRFDLAAVNVTGNQNFSRENILRSLPALEVGKSPDVKELARELSLANEHPAKRMSIHIKESAKPDHLDAEVQVRDAPDHQTIVGLAGGTRDTDNSINQNTGYTRLTFAHQQSNLFDRDHVLTLAYTTSPEYVSRVTQLGAFYWLPLYGYNTSLSAYWTHSDVDNGSIGVGGQSFTVSGRGDFYGLRATHALRKLGEFSQDISVAIDNRTFESDIGFEGTPLPVSEVGSRPVSLRYTARVEQIGRGVGGYVEYVTNISGGRANDAVSYDTARSGASQDWEAYRYGIDANYLLGRWTLGARFRGQYANEPLIPGEQFGIGGAASVRGLREREASGDKGYFFSVEAQGPGMTSAGVVPFFFYDQGARTHVTPVVGLSTHDTASSAGGGVRWTWRKQLELSATFATVIQGLSNGTPNSTPSGHDKLYFSVFYHF